jgi:hypothetical protein
MAVLATAARREIRLLLIALSLGSLVLVLRWCDLESLESAGTDYFRAAPGPPAHNLLAATVVASLMVAGLLRLAWLWAQKHPRWQAPAHAVFLLTLAYPVESFRRYWNFQARAVDGWANAPLLGLEAILAAGIVLRLAGSARIVRAACTVTLLVTPLIPAILIDLLVGRGLAGRGAGFAAPQPAPALPPRPGPAPRLLWLLFDEFDQGLAFDASPIPLPELRRLRSEAAVATQVRQAGPDTLTAVPAMLSGRSLAVPRVAGASTLLLTPPAAGQTWTWSGRPGVFHSARKLGVNSQVVGWYHPYCRVLGQETARCASFTPEPSPALQWQAAASRLGLWSSIRVLFQMEGESLAALFRPGSMAGWLRSQERRLQELQQEEYFQIQALACQAARDPGIGLAFVHFPAPHPFPIYDRRSQSFNLRDGLDYLDNLALVDRAVGELRRALEQSGLWERTAVLITSDHGFRPELWRGRLGWSEATERLTAGGGSRTVPLILRIPGSPPARTDAPLSAEVAADLSLAVLSGSVPTNAGAAAWLEQRAREDRR